MVEPIRSKAKIKAILDDLKKTDVRNYMLLKIGLNSALRISDLLKLQAKHFVCKDGHLREHFHVKERKTGKGRDIPTERFGKDLVQYLKYYELEGTDFVFFNKWKPQEAIKPCNAWVIMNRIGKKHGIKNLGTHSIRKTWAYHYYKDTGDLRLVMKILNHSSMAHTLCYLGITQEDIDGAFKRGGF
jgi:integrase